LHWDADEDDLVLTSVRRIGDKHTCTINFDVFGISGDQPASTADAAIESSIFQVKTADTTVNRHERFKRYELTCVVTFHHAIFEHAYITVLPLTTLGQKIYELELKVDDATRLELAKVPDDQRSRDYDSFMGEGRERFISPACFKWSMTGTPVPEGWMYYDDDLIKQLDKLWKKYGEAGDVVGG
jgi:hypothetical protein